jgi:hypothetical protein
MSHPLFQDFDRFLFDPVEGLADLELMFERMSKAISWVQQAKRKDRKPGWLRRGLFGDVAVSWVGLFFDSLLELSAATNDQDHIREVIGKSAELIALLPDHAPQEDLYFGLLRHLDVLTVEMERAWCLASLVSTVAKIGETRWSAAFFQETIRLARGFVSEEEQTRLAASLAEAFGGLGGSAWIPRLFEAVIAMLRTFREPAIQQRALQLVFEQFLGFERLRPTLSQVPLTKHLSLMLVSVGVTNEPAFRAGLARRVHFLTTQLRGSFEVVPDSWDECLEACQTIEGWVHEERTLQGDVRWRLSPLAALLGLLARDFCRAHNRGWVQRFFHRLCERLFQLPPGEERELAIRELLHGLISHARGFESETIAWIQHVLQVADSVNSDLSHVYEGMFLGFLGQGDVHRAESSANRILHAEMRDRAFEQLSLAWLQQQQPQQALAALYEMSEHQLRSRMVLRLSTEPLVVTDPVACAMLFRIASSLPAVVDEVLHNVVSHPSFPREAREEIMRLTPQAPLGLFARNERLQQLEQLRAHLPETVYRRERQALLGLRLSPETDREDTTMTSISIDRPHRYGDGLYLTSAEHIQKNHFGEHVAGSRFTAWSSFQEMWDDIGATVEEKVTPEEKVQVLALDMPMDVGVTGVMPLEEAPSGALSTEIRNGQPSLYCTAAEVRQPTRTITVVVGPGSIAKGELEGYEGHDLPCVLYTVYPGKPAYPFPRCAKDSYNRLETSLQAAVSLVRAGQVEEAKTVLYEVYSRMEGSEESARYWSQHVLIH